MEVWKMILLANWVICRFHVSLGCNLNAFQSQSGNVSVSPPSGHGQVDGGKLSTFWTFLKKTFTFTNDFPNISFTLQKQKIHRNLQLLNLKKTNMLCYNFLSHFWVHPHPYPHLFPYHTRVAVMVDGGGCGGPRHLQGDWYWLFEAACLSRPVVAFAAMSWWEGKVFFLRVFGWFCWLKENTRFRKGERFGKSGKDLKIYSWLIGSSYRICRWFGCCICWCIPINKYICSCVCMCAWDRRYNNTYYTYLSADCA